MVAKQTFGRIKGANARLLLGLNDMDVVLSGHRKLSRARGVVSRSTR